MVGFPREVITKVRATQRVEVNWAKWLWSGKCRWEIDKRAGARTLVERAW